MIPSVAAPPQNDAPSVAAPLQNEPGIKCILPIKQQGNTNFLYHICVRYSVNKNDVGQENSSDHLVVDCMQAVCINNLAKNKNVFSNQYELFTENNISIK